MPVSSPARRLARLLALAAGAFALAVASAAPKAYVGNFKDSTVSVIDTGAGTVVKTVPVAAGPHGMAVSPDGRFVWVAGEGSTHVSVIDTASDTVARTVDVGASPHGLSMLPDGKAVLVGVYGADRVAFVDTATGAVAATVAVAKPHTIAVRPDGKVAVVASQEPGHFALVVVDLDKRAVARRIELEQAPRDPEFSADGKLLYLTRAGVNALRVIDPASDRVVADIPTGASPHLGKSLGATVGAVVVQGPGELLVFDPEKNTAVRSIAVGKQPHWMASDGKTVWVTNEGSNDLTVVDLASGSTKAIAVGNAPRKVVVQPTAAGGTAAAPGAVSIANFAFAPASLVVAPGTTVTWRNDDGAPHAIAFADGAAPSDLLLPGQNFARTFATAGTFAYSCSVHPYMQGTVTVRP